MSNPGSRDNDSIRTGIPISDESAFLRKFSPLDDDSRPDPPRGIRRALLIAVNAVTTILRLNSFYRQKKLLEFSVDFTVDADGIHARSERGDSDLPWNRITYIQETRHAFYIFITDTHANVMPKDQLKSNADVDALRALFQKHLDASHLKVKNAG